MYWHASYKKMTLMQPMQTQGEHMKVYTVSGLNQGPWHSPYQLHLLVVQQTSLMEMLQEQCSAD